MFLPEVKIKSFTYAARMHRCNQHITEKNRSPVTLCKGQKKKPYLRREVIHVCSRRVTIRRLSLHSTTNPRTSGLASAAPRPFLLHALTLSYPPRRRRWAASEPSPPSSTSIPHPPPQGEAPGSWGSHRRSAGASGSRRVRGRPRSCSMRSRGRPAGRGGGHPRARQAGIRRSRRTRRLVRRYAVVCERDR